MNRADKKPIKKKPKKVTYKKLLRTAGEVRVEYFLKSKKLKP